MHVPPRIWGGSSEKLSHIILILRSTNICSFDNCLGNWDIEATRKQLLDRLEC